MRLNYFLLLLALWIAVVVARDRYPQQPELDPFSSSSGGSFGASTTSSEARRRRFTARNFALLPYRIAKHKVQYTMKKPVRALVPKPWRYMQYAGRAMRPRRTYRKYRDQWLNRYFPEH